MENEISDRPELTFQSPEIQNLLADIMEQSNAIKKREELSADSFRLWLCETITAIAQRLGYTVRNLLIDIPADIAYSFGKGFKAGVEKARRNSYRYRDQDR